MLSIEWFRHFLSWVSLPVLAVLAGIFLWRRLYREFPLFFSYIVVTELVTITRLVAYAIISTKSFSNVYWISNLLATVFGILAVYEVFVRRLFSGFYKIRFYRYLFPAIAITITILAVSTALLSPDKGAFFGTLDRVLTFVRVALLGFFTALMLLMGREWTRYELGIAFGFGLLTAVSFFTSAMWIQPRYRNGIVNDLPRVAWDIACLIWLVCFGKPAKKAVAAPTKPINPEVLHEAKNWEGALKSWLTSPRKKR
jgi:hypothetical protein